MAIGNIRKVRVPLYALFIKECRGNRIYKIELKFTRVISLFIMHKSLSDKEKKGHEIELNVCNEQNYGRMK